MFRIFLQPYVSQCDGDLMVEKAPEPARNIFNSHREHVLELMKLHGSGWCRALVVSLQQGAPMGFWLLVPQRPEQAIFHFFW
jgi:hypothetical protein